MIQVLFVLMKVTILQEMLLMELNKDETKMVCFGRMSQGDTLGGKDISANTQTILFEFQQKQQVIQSIT